MSQTLLKKSKKARKLCTYQSEVVIRYEEGSSAHRYLLPMRHRHVHVQSWSVLERLQTAGELALNVTLWSFQ